MSGPDYFSAFGLSPSFDIDPADLEKRYFLAQREFHPDRMVSKSVQSRAMAISRSMTLNSAYEALKSPLKRAQYLLSLHGIKIDSIKPSQVLLMENMELREQLLEATVIDELVALEQHNHKDIENVVQQLSQVFRGGKFSLAGNLVMRLSYLAKMSEEIRIKRKSLSQEGRSESAYL